MKRKPVCSLNASSWVVGAACKTCGHNGFVHPGVHNRTPACVVCELEDVRWQMEREVRRAAKLLRGSKRS